MATTRTFPVTLAHPEVEGTTTVGSPRSLALHERKGWVPVYDPPPDDESEPDEDPPDDDVDAY